jgi:hypothetical protein
VSDLTDSEREAFDEMTKGVTDDLVADQARGLLDRQMARAGKWIAQREANGESATLPDLIRHTLRERNKRHHVIIAYCAALFRLMGKDK